MKDIGLYIHIPFCKRKCYYCDFCSYDSKVNLYQKYIKSIISEIKNIKNYKSYIIKSIYIGGGTPSILDSKCIIHIVNTIKQRFLLAENIEITIEVNPESVSEAKLKDYKLAGINRLSIGLQSCDDKILKNIGRIHNYNQFNSTLDTARKIGFNNINVDLMIGLPTQSITNVEESIQKIIKKSPEHISVYSLILEEGTMLEDKINKGIFKLPDEDTERIMYWKVKKLLEEHGYIQYEISNFAKKSFESKHNTDCWNQKEYIGVGVAAHSYLNNIRFSNIYNLEEYICNIEKEKHEHNIIIHEKQNLGSMMNEYMILGLRMIEGIDVKKFQTKFNKNPIEVYRKQLDKLIKKGLIEFNDKNIKLTKKGIDFANVVWEEFI